METGWLGVMVGDRLIEPNDDEVNGLVRGTGGMAGVTAKDPPVPTANDGDTVDGEALPTRGALEVDVREDETSFNPASIAPVFT